MEPSPSGPGAPGGSVGVSAPALPANGDLRPFVDALVAESRTRPGMRGWFGALVITYLRHHERQAVRRPSARSETEEAHAVVRRACMKSAITGAGCGTLSTAATLLAAETQGAGLFVSLPAAVLAIGVEMLYRSFVHLEMTCALADVFGVRFSPDQPGDLWILYGLVFGTHEHEESDDEGDPGRGLLRRLTETEGKEIGDEIGGMLLGESVLRNIIPVVGIGASAIANWRLTGKVGETVRHYVRYRRALRDALAGTDAISGPERELLVEGFWHVFTADGRLNREEAATLASELRRLDPAARTRVLDRIAGEDDAFLDRLPALPEAERDRFLHALAVAAAVDKSVSRPEEKLLEKSAQALGRPFDLGAVRELVRQLEATGVLGQARG